MSRRLVLLDVESEATWLAWRFAVTEGRHDETRLTVVTAHDRPLVVDVKWDTGPFDYGTGWPDRELEQLVTDRLGEELARTRLAAAIAACKKKNRRYGAAA
jgi:hypothetical protein